MLIERTNLNKPAEILGMLSSLFVWNTRIFIHLISLQRYEVILIPRIYIAQGYMLTGSASTSLR